MYEDTCMVQDDDDKHALSHKLPSQPRKCRALWLIASPSRRLSSLFFVHQHRQFHYNCRLPCIIASLMIVADMLFGSSSRGWIVTRAHRVRVGVTGQDHLNTFLLSGHSSFV